jgi:hypothetical protein
MFNWFKLSQQNQGFGAVIPGEVPQYNQNTQTANQSNNQQFAQILNQYSSQLKNMIASSGIPGAKDIAAMITSVGQINKGVFSALPINNLPNNIGGQLVAINSKMIETFNNAISGIASPQQIQNLNAFIKQKHDENYAKTINIIKSNSATKKASSSCDDCFNQNQGMMMEKINQMIPMLEEMKNKISDSDKIEGWELEHITTAHDDISEVYSYINQKTRKNISS